MFEVKSSGACARRMHPRILNASPPHLLEDAMALDVTNMQFYQYLIGGGVVVLVLAALLYFLPGARLPTGSPICRSASVRECASARSSR